MIRLVPLLFLSIVFANAAWADHDEGATRENASRTAAVDATEGKKLSGAEKKAAKDQEIAALVEQHNETVESDLDEVVCERVRITGTRRKIQVCKTKREVLAEQESAQRMMRQRNKAGSDPPMRRDTDL